MTRFAVRWMIVETSSGGKKTIVSIDIMAKASRNVLYRLNTVLLSA